MTTIHRVCKIIIIRFNYRRKIAISLGFILIINPFGITNEFSLLLSQINIYIRHIYGKQIKPFIKAADEMNCDDNFFWVMLSFHIRTYTIK